MDMTSSQKHLHQPQQPQQQVFENIPLRTVESHWEAVFGQFDRNGDGRVSVSQMSRQLSAHNPGVPPYVIRKIVELADENADRYITYPEFLRMVESPQSQELFRNYFQSYVKCFVPKQQRVVEAVDGSYEQEYTCYPPAIAMVVFSVIMIFIFIFDKLRAYSSVATTAPFFSIFVYDPHKRAEVWRFLTYMFIHANELHISVNLCIQILLGIPLEMVHRWWRILIIYVAGVVSGSLFTSIVDPDVYLAGASGGVYSLLAAHIATIILNWTEMDHPALQLSIFLILAITDTSNAVYNRYVAKVDTRIAYAAHIAGAGAGFLVGVYVLRNLRVRPWERILWWVCFVLFNVLLVSAIIWNVFYTSYFPPQLPFAENLFQYWG